MCDKSVDESNGKDIETNGSVVEDMDVGEDDEEEDNTDDEVSDDDDDEDNGSDEGLDVTEDEDNEGSEASADEDEDTDEEEEAVDEGCDADAISMSPTDGSAPTCYVCLNRFCGQDIGSPDCCPDLHYFCLDCIEEWSKQINTCPVDRKRFTYIVVRREIGSAIIMKLPIVQNIVPDIESVPEDVTYCEICGRCDREDRLLLCDGCDFGYHCECLSPPIETIPIEEWFCPDCYQRLFGAPEANGSLSMPALQRRAIARTGASEVVRQRILARRTQRKKTTTKRKTRRKTTKRKRKTTKRKTSAKKGTTVKGRRRKRRTKKRRKRRTKKSALSSRRLPAPFDPRTRIASKLGIGPAPKSPFGLPSMKNMAYESIRKITDLRAAAGISHLSLFGTELDVYDPRVQMNDDENDLLLDSVGLMARSRVGAGRHIASPLNQKSHSLSNDGQPNGLSFVNSSSINLLSDIMSAQTLLHSSARDVRIGRDGSLHLNRVNSSPGSLPVRSCPGSGQSSPARSPHSASTSTTPIHTTTPTSSSPQRTDSNSNNSVNSNRYSFGSAGGIRSESNGDKYDFAEDIATIKPVAVAPTALALNADNEDSKLELYSDIESIGGDNNRDDSAVSDAGDEGVDQLVIDEQKPGSNLTKDAIEVQSNEGLDEQIDAKDVKASTDNKPKTNAVIDANSVNISASDSAKAKSPKKQPNYGQPNRRPSIRDLFGDSDDEDDDTDIRRLLEAQGSINVHYPMKIPIVLKNSISKKETIGGGCDDKARASSDTTTKTTTTGSCNESSAAPAVYPIKWIAVTPVDTITTSVDTITTSTSSANKWKAIESVDENVVLDECKTVSTDDNMCQTSDQLSESDRDVVNAMDVVEDDDKDLTIDESIAVNVSECDNTAHDDSECAQQSATSVFDEEEGEIRDDLKVRRCRHGRIRREKTKDGAKESSKRGRSRSGESKAKDKHNKSGAKDVVEPEDVVDEECVEFKEKTIESLNPELMDTENGDRIGWKKLSTTTKMRSYRDKDGPKDPELMFKEREVSKKLLKKSISAKSKSKDVAKVSSDRHCAHEQRLKEHNSRRLEDMTTPEDGKHMRKHMKSGEKSDNSRRHKRKVDDQLLSSSAKRLKRRDESGGRKSGDEYDKDRHKGRHHKSSRHKHSSVRKEGSEGAQVGGGGDCQRRHSHRSSKHSHHKNKSVGDDDDVLVGHMMSTGGGSGGPPKILRDHSSYADITPLDSKEIYAEGDRIVINVNFKRENNSKKHDISAEEAMSEASDVRNKSSTSESSTKRSSTKRDDSIYWASPPPPTSSATASAQAVGQSSEASTPLSPKKTLTTTISRSDDDFEQTASTRSTGSEKSDQLSGKSDSKQPSDELRFLPRTLHQSDVRPTGVSEAPVKTFGPHTPEGEYCEDQFMPTPTQDESQSPLRSPSITDSSNSSPLSGRSSPQLSNSAKDDVYDPEAPLQSPPDQQPKTQSPHKKSNSSRRPEPKSPDVSSRRESSKPSPNKRTTGSGTDHKARYESSSSSTSSSKDMSKASPAAPLSTTKSTHSPFKAPTVLAQRQQMKASPQKLVLSTQQKSSSALMPPPSAPTSRSLAAAFASINQQNLAQLLQMAQTLTSKASAKHHRQPQSGSGHHHHQPRHGSTAPVNASQNTSQNHSQNTVRDHNRDHNEVVDMDVESPSPPQASQQARVSSTTGVGAAQTANTSSSQVKTLWDQIIKSTQQTPKRANSGAATGTRPEPGKKGGSFTAPSNASTSLSQKDRHHSHRHQVVNIADNKQSANNGSKLDQLTVLDDVPSSAVEMAVKEKFIKKLNRQERVIEEVKLVLKPHYQKRTITKDEYKEILRKSVPKICHSRSGEINPQKIKSLIEGYVKRYKYLRKKSKKLPKK